jgi:hypothetical protein
MQRIYIFTGAFVGPTLGYLLLTFIVLVKPSWSGIVSPSIFFMSAILNFLFAAPALLFFMKYIKGNVVSSALIAGASVFLPALVLSSPLFSFEELPEYDVYYLPLFIFFTFGIFTGVIFSICSYYKLFTIKT